MTRAPLTSNLWILKSKGPGSAFGGNEGYDDQNGSHYIYNTTVKNYDKISKDDIIIIAGKKYVEYARVFYRSSKTHDHRESNAIESAVGKLIACLTFTCL